MQKSRSRYRERLFYGAPGPTKGAFLNFDSKAVCTMFFDRSLTYFLSQTRCLNDVHSLNVNVFPLLRQSDDERAVLERRFHFMFGNRIRKRDHPRHAPPRLLSLVYMTVGVG